MNHDMHSSKLEQRHLVNQQTETVSHKPYYSCVYKFRDIEDVINLAHRLPLPFFNSKLIRYHHFYYLSVMYPQERMIRRYDWGESIILEYGERTNESIYRLEEYGKVILAENAIATVRDYFHILD
ncbi:Negative regulator of genetic competence [Caldalkalibacillus thermarum TA2.A1]|uniref:Adaptor protein MecA n=1 Tax=Caldalkalibacillus thermarum (strain TA2.A1) TaxID=986075 RepID=F5L679_CALTT|nr:adaptor protein MecA [Caldalkalibacillus thermarum]EGL83179.1 Negative regulator of genetic competence [Caldalkalibacillus thermarum TA2.A1]QZT35106.1 adaptor protein MecA [Caldalkalibacillus thermarum TA2.A1]